MSTFKKCQVVMLPTNEKAIVGSIVTRPSDNRMATVNVLTINDPQPCVHQHLYFLSDEEIKEGDWIYNNKENIVEQITSKTELIFVLEENKENQTFKKIIATTNEFLFFKDKNKSPKQYMGSYISMSLGENLPQPSQQFIEKYIEEYNKGNIITEVTVEYEYLPGQRIEADPEIHGIKLKINPKDNTITIRKIKDSWTREEVVNLISRAFSNNNLITNQRASDLDKWIEENL